MTLSDTRRRAKAETDVRYRTVMSTVARDKVISARMVRRYISSLNNGCSPGMDGIMAEHLKYAIDSHVTFLFGYMLTLCIQFHVVPKSFTKGILIPILKKATLDPSASWNYRPVTVSTVFSRILELYILYNCGGYEMNDQQFGFVTGRSTNMAAVLAQDVISYCKSRGSPVFACSLDAQGAFDTIPHDVIFYKAMGAIPKDCWATLLTWYTSITVQIK